MPTIGLLWNSRHNEAQAPARVFVGLVNRSTFVMLSWKT